MPRAPFTPLLHGFKFSNGFINHVVKVPILGIDVTTAGRCGGMAYASLDYWHHRLAVPDDDDLPKDGSLVGDYIYWRLIESMFANGFKFFHFMRTPDHPTWINGIGVARATREEEYPRIKASIDAGRPCVVGLSQARDISSIGGDHQVVAIGYEDGTPYSKVILYDNNHPGTEQTLTFKSAYDPSEREVRHSNGSVWRSFFMEAYEPRVPYYLVDGRLVSDRSDPNIYVEHGGGRFHIPSADEFNANGYKWNAILRAQDGSMAHLPRWPANGTLVRERTHTELYVVYGGKAFQAPSLDVLTALGLAGKAVTSIPDGSAAGLRAVPYDDMLLRELSGAIVYVMKDGKLRALPSVQEFERRHFNWSLVGVVPDGGLVGIPVGDPLEDTSQPPGAPIPPPPRSWAERRRGSVYTSDGDVIYFEIMPNALAVNSVEFVLELGYWITWRKELVLREGNGPGTWTIGLQDKVSSGRKVLYRNQLPGGSVLFRKAKLFGMMTDIHGLGNLEQLPNGARVTFTWSKD